MEKKTEQDNYLYEIIKECDLSIYGKNIVVSGNVLDKKLKEIKENKAEIIKLLQGDNK